MEKFFVTEARDLSDGILSGQQRKKELDGHVPGVCIFLFFYRRKKLMINLSALQHTHTERDNIFKAFPSRHF
jgi:hypothetical protein